MVSIAGLSRAADCLLGDDANVDDRLAACDRLAGAVGRRAIEALVRALDHGASRVRLRAVSALASSSTGRAAPRLVHAALHKRADVRRAALDHPLPAEIALALLGDPRVADDARAHLIDRASREPALLAAALVARRRRQLTDVELREIARALPWTTCTPFLRALPAGTPSTATTLSARLATLGDDHLVDLVTVIAGDDDTATGAAAGIVTAIRRRDLDTTDLQRLATAIVVVAAGGARVAAPLVAVAVNGFVDVLAFDAIDVEHRRAACRALVSCGVARHADVFDTLARERLWATDGGLDLDVVAGLQRLCSEKPYAWIDDPLPVPKIVDAFVHRPTTSLLSLPPTNADDRRAAQTLVRAIGEAWRCYREVVPAAVVLAAIVTSIAEPLPLIEQLDDIEPGLAMRVVHAVLDLDDHVDLDADDNAVAERRCERAIEILLRRQPWASLAGLLRHAAEQLTSSARARLLLATVGRVVEVKHLAVLVDGLAPRHRERVVDVMVDVVPPLLDDEGHDEGDGLLAILRRRTEGPRPLDDDERARLAAASDDDIGRAALAIIGGRRRTGLCALLQQWGRLRRDTRLFAAVVASHDPPAVVSDAVSRLWPDLAGVDRAAVSRTLAHLNPRALPLLALVFLDDDDAGLDALLAEIRDAPGGLRGLITLALYLPPPIDLVVLDALVHVARSGAAPPSIFDERLRASLRTVLDDTASGPLRERLLTLLVLAGGTVTDTAINNDSKGEDDALFGDDDAAFARWIDQHKDTALTTVLLDALITGQLPTSRLLALLRAADEDTGDVVIEAIRSHHDNDGIAALVKLLPLSSSSPRLERLREVAAWGARQSIALVGRPLGVTFIGDALGYTRLRSSRIHINPLPLLLDDRDGADIVMGLMVHELGHQRYHAGDVGLRVWEQAQTERLAQVLNLVADEHLERNLRAISPGRYGHRLQVLAAWAFQHRNKEVELSTLLSSLGARAAAVLTRQPIGVGRQPTHVVVDIGAAITALEQQGSPFSRFMRALRMGKGDRFGDVVVARALALFPAATFRTLEMPALLTIARQLRDLFGDELSLLQTFDFHQVTDASANELLGSGVSMDDLDDAGEGPRERRAATNATRARAGRSAKNTDADTSFDRIDQVEHVVADAAAHAVVVSAVRRPAALLRRTLFTLGQTITSHRRRLSGQRVDRSNLVNVVVRNDPRLLVARRSHLVADLFVGVVIDCSGSMRGENLQRAQHFATVVAEAARGLAAVDARFFGFTDRVIYDAGDARRCAVTGLATDGGNNDAAGLDYAASIAVRSRRQVKLIVMISDGAPTECSVDALSALVTRLGRRGVLCAQVAVTAIDDICFPHHVLLDDDDLAGAVRRFTVVIERLVHLGVTSARRTGTTTAYTSQQFRHDDDDDEERR